MAVKGFKFKQTRATRGKNPFSLEGNFPSRSEIRAFDVFAKEEVGNVRFRMHEAATKIRNEILVSMRNTPKTGRRYTRYNPKRIHIASSPGNPPAVDTGQLWTNVLQVNGVDFAWIYVSPTGAPYAEALEFGSGGAFGSKPSSSRSGGFTGTNPIKPRPFFRPAVDKIMPETTMLIKQDSDQLVKESSKRWRFSWKKNI